MSEYDFSTMNSTDLETLVCDLLNAQQPIGSIIKYKTFKEGKDKGIDLLYSTTSNFYEHVGQVKHYYRSGYDNLISKLKNTELEKIKVLNPSKYIVATSVDLSVDNSRKILAALSPYIKNLNDIYGKKDLNRLISTYPHVLDSHFKLWFSNTSVLQKLINSNLEFRSVDFNEYQIKKRLSIYVETPSFSKARHILKENKYIVITGEPGVGKTTLAEMLAYEYIKDDYKLIYVYDSIRDADQILSSDNKKQIIYFDDFLGTNEMEINKSRGSDTFLNKVLRRVKNGVNKYLIFTTRKHILNMAILESENLRRFNLLTGETVLHLDEYNFDIKKQLLMNHIETSELQEELRSVLYSKDVFNFILNHKHYAPRSVEYITSKESVSNKSPNEFKEFIKESFNNPKEIWKHAYSFQLNEDDRLLLNTLLSFGDDIDDDRLELAFEARVKYEIDNNNKIRGMHAYRNAYNRLLGGFIYTTQDQKIRFINPSLLDFLLNHLKSDRVEVFKIASSVIYVDQLTKRLFSLYTSKIKESMPDLLKHRLLSSYESFLTGHDDDNELIILALVIFKYIKTEEAENIVYNILHKIEDWNQFYSNYELGVAFQEFMEEVRDNDVLNNLVEEKIVEIITNLIIADWDFHNALKLLSNLTTKYKVDLSDHHTTQLEDHFNEIIQDFISNEVEFLKDFIYDESEIYELTTKLESMVDSINDLGLSVDLDLKQINSEDWYEIVLLNGIRRQMEKDD